jgi:hypothetical protein
MRYTKIFSGADHWVRAVFSKAFLNCNIHFAGFEPQAVYSTNLTSTNFFAL